jgi:glycosyltransferase involved in cell wall biosynthesis
MPASDRIRASVIVPVYNGARTLGACLRALDAQTVQKDSYEIIVVDDGSTDGSAAVATQHGVTIIRQENAGPAAARNEGVRRAGGQILLFTDADCEPRADWIEQMLSPFEDPTVTGAKGIYDTRQRAVVARFTQAEYEEKYDRLARLPQIDFVDTYAAAYRRDVFMAHGGFDEGFRLDEDQEFSFRLAQAGCKLVFVPQALVYHQHPDTLWKYARRKAGLGYWKVQVHGRHPAKAIRDSYTPETQKVQLILLPLGGVLVAAALLGLAPWLLAALAAGVGLLSTVPLMRKAARLGWAVVLATPALALVRALALDIGVLWGLLGQLGQGRGGQQRRGS